RRPLRRSAGQCRPAGSSTPAWSHRPARPALRQDGHAVRWRVRRRTGRLWRDPYAWPGRSVRRHDERNLRMNAVVDSIVSTPTAAARPVAWPQRMRWLLQREFWEHKGGFFWAPLVAGAVSLLLTLLGGGTGLIVMHRHGANMINYNGAEIPL